MDSYWISGGKLVTPSGVLPGAVKISNGRIAEIRPKTGNRRALNARGLFIAPGFIDLHVWGDPRLVAEDAIAHGTTGFLTTLGPAPQRQLLRHVRERADQLLTDGAACLGIHLEGPFVSQKRAGALPSRWMRAPKVAELKALAQAARGRLRLVTMAPDLPGAIEAIRWCARQHITVSLGHTEADAATSVRAVEAGARAVTHVFNGMKPFHHRASSLLDVALTDDRVTAMVIADGIHISAFALRLLLRSKSAERTALVTDSIRRQGWRVWLRRGAYYTRSGVLAGSCLTMIGAVKNAVQLAGASLPDAVRMASEIPARLLGIQHQRGRLAVGLIADLVAFDKEFRVHWTVRQGQWSKARS